MRNSLQRNAFSSATCFLLQRKSHSSEILLYSKLWRILLKYTCIYEDSKIVKSM
ncbi:hypothetical protein BDZ91DRAFT_720721 [Kalaharituber pfeilii]|nr:hypothetical protein BDZ91DRAFT_720721 [Kalaharituber pfeilii]